MKMRSKKCIRICWLCLCFIMLPLLAAAADCSEAPSFFNDRTADITGRTLFSHLDMSLSGRGQIIGLADSGLDKGSISNIHPDLQGSDSDLPRILLLRSYAGRELADDPDGHGTHMAGIIVGSGQESQGQYRGVAPGASLYFQALLNQQGILTLPSTITALFVPAYEAGVRVHVDGWGVENNAYSDRARDIDDFTWRHNDFLPIFSAGNRGPHAGTLSQEANSKNALVVGASQSVRPGWSSESAESAKPMPASSSGPTADGRIKPDLSAPGSALLSTCSSLVDSNYPENSAYTYLGGSSMAAAVVGGNVALLRQYLAEVCGQHNPSAALLKALLINGSRLSAADQRAQLGWGILDTAGTLLPMRKNLFQWKEDWLSAEGNRLFREYRFNVTDASYDLPVRVTLVWNDPASMNTEAVQELVNDLDLVVVDPQGRYYSGNNFLSGAEEQADHVNNVEIVHIPHPNAGTYTIRVQADSLHAAYQQQPFAVVYGQNVIPAVIVGREGQQIRLSDGQELLLDNRKSVYYLNGASAEPQTVAAGAQIYETADKIYMFADVWESSGVQRIETEQGQLFVNINNTREGGYIADKEGLEHTKQTIQYNQETTPVDAFINGSGIKAVINPFRQKIWQIQGNGTEVEGHIEYVDLDSGQLTLLGDSVSYNLSPQTVLNFQNRSLDSDTESLPFTFTETPDLNHLVPSMRVKMLVDPQTRQIHFINVYKDVVISRIKQIGIDNGSFELQNGKTYHIFPGSAIYRDRKPAELKDLAAGDWLIGTKMDISDQLLAISCFSQVGWGQAIYVSAANHNLYLRDADNNFVILQLAADVEIYSRGHSISLNSLEPGSWIRVFKAPDTDQVHRIDVAEMTLEINAHFTEYKIEQQLLVCQDGRQYSCDANTIFIRGGHRVGGPDFLWNESIKITLLKGPSSESSLIAKVEAGGAAPDIKTARLECQIYALNGALVLKGNTDAETAVVFRQDGQRTAMVVDKNGNFSQLLPWIPEEKELTVAVFDNTARAAALQEVAITDFPCTNEAADFNDIHYHPQRAAIEYFKKAGMVSGYDDGSFRPDEPIKRIEFWLLLRKLEADTSGSIKNLYRFRDYTDVPWWGLPGVSTADLYGWLEESAFYISPQAEMTWAELGAIIKKTYAHNLEYGAHKPQDPVTRGDAVQALYDVKYN